MKNPFSTCWMLLVALAVIAGCATQQHNPIEGWKALGSAYRISCPFGQAIIDDYQTYIQNLPANEKSSVSDSGIRFYESSTGKRAVTISTATKSILWDVRWDHVLIYDGNNKRVRTAKIKIGRSAS